MFNKIVCFTLTFVCIATFGCTATHSPIQANGELEFGRYLFMAPEGYWYFPKKYPATFKTSKDIFLITFWKDKEALSRKNAKEIGVFINFAVSPNTYKNFETYYIAAKELGIKYEELPEEAFMLKTIANWSCKQTGQGVFGIECTSLGDDLVTFGVYGNDKGIVMSNVSLLQRMLESFKVQ